MSVVQAASPSPVKQLQDRARRWADARRPRTDTLLLTQRNVYILPTKAGLLFAATVFVLLLASINYQLNLGYLLTFLLAGSGIASMHITHSTLRGLTLHLKPIAPAFAGESVRLDAVFTSPAQARFGIGLRVAGAPLGTRVWVDVPAQGQAGASISFVAAARGFNAVPTLSAETRFPLGLFKAWTLWRPAAQALVYPQPELPAAPLPPAAPVPDGPATRLAVNDGGEVEGVRAYRRGDPPKLIAWKKAAKALEAGGELVSRDTTHAVHQALWLDWAQCGPLPPEARLSRLTAWTLGAHRAGAEFGLVLPGRRIELASGDAHRRDCLEALALWA